MGSNYREGLSDPRWQRARLKVMERDGWKCRTCGDESSELHVHHSSYRSGAEGPWDYEDAVLITLCHACHEAVHKYGGWAVAAEPPPRRSIETILPPIAFPENKRVEAMEVDEIAALCEALKSDELNGAAKFYADNVIGGLWWSKARGVLLFMFERQYAHIATEAITRRVLNAVRARIPHATSVVVEVQQ